MKNPILAIMTSVALSFGAGAYAADDYKITLKLSHVFSPAEDLTKFMDEVAGIIKKKTDGAINIQTFPQGQIATYKDGLEQVVRGANFISVEDPSYVGDYVPDFKALVGPMLYDSYDEYSKLVRNTKMVADMKKAAEAKGIKILALDYIFGFRSVITDREITKPQDLKGVKIRTPGSKLFIDTLTAMGATATPLPWGETLSAVSQGVVDGLEGSEFTNLGTKVYEVRKRVALTRHFLGTCGVYISNDVWNKIPAKYQKIVADEFDAGALRMIETMKGKHGAVVKELQTYGVKFNEVDKSAFKEATARIYKEIPGLSPNMYENLVGELKKIRAAK